MRGELGLGDRRGALGGRGRNGGGKGKQGDSRDGGVETGGFHGRAAWHFRCGQARRVRRTMKGGKAARGWISAEAQRARKARKRVVAGEEVSGRVTLGGSRLIKQQI